MATKTKKKRTKLKIGMIMELTSANNASAFFVCAEAMGVLGHSWQVIAAGDAKSQQQCFRMYEALGKSFEMLESTQKNKEEVLKECDVCFFPSSPSASQKKMLIKHNCIPICPVGTGIIDFNPIKEVGEGFVYEKQTHWHMIDALSRAAYNFGFPYDWKNLKKNLQVLEIVPEMAKRTKKARKVGV